MKLRKLLSIIVVLFLFISETQAQRAFDKGDVGFNLGLSVGSYVGDLTPAVNVSLEFGMFPVGKVGVVSLGGYSDIGIGNNGNLYPHLAARGIFHLGILKTSKFDLYGGIASGFRLYDNAYYNRTFYHSEFIGGRIMTSSNFGFFAEAGWGASNLKLGMTWVF